LSREGGSDSFIIFGCSRIIVFQSNPVDSSRYAKSIWDNAVMISFVPGKPKVVTGRGGGRGGREGSNAPPHLPKTPFTLGIFFQKFWLPPLKNSSRGKYFSKGLKFLTHTEVLLLFQVVS